MVSFLKIQSRQESRFQEPNNYKGSGDRKIMNLGLPESSNPDGYSTCNLLN